MEMIYLHLITKDLLSIPKARHCEDNLLYNINNSLWQDHLLHTGEGSGSPTQAHSSCGLSHNEEDEENEVGGGEEEDESKKGDD